MYKMDRIRLWNKMLSRQVYVQFDIGVWKEFETGRLYVNSSSGRVPDSRSRSSSFEPHWKHCVVSLNKTLYPLLSTGATQEDWPNITETLLTRDLKNQIKQTQSNN